MTQCPHCGKDNPAEIHTCTPLALRLAEQLEDTESARLHLLPYAAAELRRLHAENVRNAVDFVEQQRELSRALDQRDDLLKALNQIAVAAEATVSNPYWIAKHARAAIAKVEGGAA